MRLQDYVLPGLALAAATVLITPPGTLGFTKTGDLLFLGQRDFRVFENFQDVAANNNLTPDSQFPGGLGAALAIWKGAAEWGSVMHGDGTGDPLQPVIGDGGADFDPIWASRATGIGNPNQNVISSISSCAFGLIAFTEAPTTDGWRIRFCDNLILFDGPGAPGINQYDIQGIACHEYGHALGLGHSAVSGATMEASVFAGTPTSDLRSIEADDIAGIQCIYGVKSASKPVITGVSVMGGMVTITGVNFDATDNTVWFTPAGPTDPAVEPIVRVTNTPSVGGTQITLPVPAGAGPGEVMVRIPGGLAGFNLSNAYPTDLGMVRVPMASATFRNGTGVNTPCLTSLASPVLGTMWQVQVDASGHPGALLTSLRCHALPLPGTLTSFGELLVDLSSPRVFSLSMASSGGADVYTVTIPPNASLAGLGATVQAFIAGGGIELCNAFDIVLGL